MSKKNRKQRNVKNVQSEKSVPELPKPIVAAPEKTSEEAPESLGVDLEKWKKQIINSLLLIGPLVVLIVALLIYYSMVQSNSQKSWQTLRNVWNTMSYKNWDYNFKVKDLGEELAGYVQKSLSSVEFLPKEWIAQDKDNKILSVEELPIVMIPTQIREKVTLEYNISQMKKHLEISKNTSAGPWVLYTLAQLYFMNQQTKEALDCYEEISSKYPKHEALDLLVNKQDQSLIKNEQEWLAKQAKSKVVIPEMISDKVAIITTSKGKFTVALWTQDFKKNTEHFINLVESGLLAGLNFYQADEGIIHSGCPMGTGKGRPEFVTTGETTEMSMQRGLVAFETTSKDETKIDSRFLILKKYPGYDMRKVCGIIGKVIDGMPIVDKLEASDIILDVALQENKK